MVAHRQQVVNSGGFKLGIQVVGCTARLACVVHDRFVHLSALKIDQPMFTAPCVQHSLHERDDAEVERIPRRIEAAAPVHLCRQALAVVVVQLQGETDACSDDALDTELGKRDPQLVKAAARAGPDRYEWRSPQLR